MGSDTRNRQGEKHSDNMDGKVEKHLEEESGKLKGLPASSPSGFVSNVKRKMLPTSSLLGLLKWNTPTVYNGWEQITHNPNYGRSCFNLEPLTDHSPEMGPMVGYAVTVKIQPQEVAKEMEEVCARMGREKK